MSPATACPAALGSCCGELSVVLEPRSEPDPDFLSLSRLDVLIDGRPYDSADGVLGNGILSEDVLRNLKKVLLETEAAA